MPLPCLYAVHGKNANKGGTLRRRRKSGPSFKGGRFRLLSDAG